MISYSPSTLRTSFALPLLKVAPGTRSTIVFQSEGIIYLNVHWLERAFVCAGDGCVGCDSLTARAKGYFVATVAVPNASLPVLVEATPQALLRLNERLQFIGSKQISGQELVVSRRSKNRGIEFEATEAVGHIEQALTSGHRLISAIAVIFGLPLPKRDQSFEDYSSMVLPHANLLLATALKQSR